MRQHTGVPLGHPQIHCRCGAWVLEIWCGCMRQSGCTGRGTDVGQNIEGNQHQQRPRKPWHKREQSPLGTLNLGRWGGVPERPNKSAVRTSRCSGFWEETVRIACPQTVGKSILVHESAPVASLLWGVFWGFPHLRRRQPSHSVIQCPCRLGGLSPPGGSRSLGLHIRGAQHCQAWHGRPGAGPPGPLCGRP